MSDFHPFYLMSLLRMRGNNSLSLNKVKKYKNYILKVTNKPLIFFYIIAVIPKFICRNIIEHNKTRKILKGLYYLVKGIIPGEKMKDSEYINYDKYVNCFEKTQNVKSTLLYGDVDSIKNPLLTVVIPTYKRADLLEEAINSILEQDVVNFYGILLL